MYQPKFIEGVKVYFGASLVSQDVNPIYCLGNVDDLKALIGAPFPDLAVAMLPPFGSQFRGYCSQTVPWFIFPNGAQVNCGLLAYTYFAHGFPEAQAIASAQWDIRTAIEAVDQAANTVVKFG